METNRLPITICWHCDQPLDAAASVDGEEIPPEQGAISLCLYCGAIAQVGDELALIRPTVELLDDLATNEKFRSAYVQFMWARQYLILNESVLRGDRADPDR